MNGRRQKFLATLTAVALAAASVFVGAVAPTPAFAAEDGDVEVLKVASTQTVEPGETFSYTMSLTCTTLGLGCTNATLTDVVPDAFTVLGATVGTGLSGDVTIEGQQVDVAFTSDLGDGTQGIPAGSTGVVTIQVQARDDLPYEDSGIAVSNTATTNADTQSGPLTSTADVTPIVPLDLKTTVAKQMDPTSGLATPGEDVTATLTASNTSNADVEELTIVDPADPPGIPNPFSTLPFTGLGTVTYPAGAEEVEILVWDGAAWQPYAMGTAPAQPTVSTSVALGDVLGVKTIFRDTDGALIEADAEASVVLTMEQGPDVASLAGNVTVVNGANSVVSLSDEEASASTSATYEIIAANIDLIAEKEFSPNSVSAGDTTVATITAGNNSEFDLTELTITEPTLTDPADPWADGFDDSMAFIAFTEGIAYPDSATAATITYYYADGTSDGPTAFGDGDIPTAPARTLVRFEITFTGTIDPGGETEIPFEVQTDEDEVGYPATIVNTADVEGVDPNGGTVTEHPTDDLLVYEAHLEIETGKQIVPEAGIYDVPGEWVIVSLEASLAEFPASTVNAGSIIVQDPAVPPASSDIDGTFWDSFNATEITQTAVPDGATLTINYWNGSAWVPLLDESGNEVVVVGPTVFSMTIPAGEQDLIEGLQFVYTADPGAEFPPGTTVEPHFTAELRADERDPDSTLTPPATVANCAIGSGDSADGTESSNDTEACADVAVEERPTGPGDALNKELSSNAYTARSQENGRIHLEWSTGGLSGIEEMTLQDEIAPPTTTGEVAQSFWEAFTIRGLAEITPDMDPLLKYDEIERVEYWDWENQAWVQPVNDPCVVDGACDGEFPGLTLTGAERNAAAGIRLVYVESPTRATTSVGDPTAPPVGSGVARSSNNEREAAVLIQVRDTLRSDPSMPATGSHDYNGSDPGQIYNDASAIGTDASGDVVISSTSNDFAYLVDVDVNVDLTKTWSNSPYGVPADTVADEDYPTGLVGLTAWNRTAAKIDELSITDPAPGAAHNPFDEFDLTEIRQVTVPEGATGSIVTLTYDSGATVDFTVADALDLVEADLEDVVGLAVTHTGRIDAGAIAHVELELRMRKYVRAVTPLERVDTDESPVTNVAQALADDAGGTTDQPATTEDSASVAITEFTLSVEASKSFSPATQTELEDGPITMTLTGQPSGDDSARVSGMVINDADPRFWEAYDYVGIDPSFSLADPINRVRMDVLIDQEFIQTPSGIISVGGHWVEGALQDEASFEANPLPAGVAPGDVEGVRFLFVSHDENDEIQQWADPIDPQQNVPVLIERRADLRWSEGVAVPSDRPDLDPAPGNPAPGEFLNRTEVVICAYVDEECTLTNGAAIDTAETPVYLEHATTAVEIEKVADVETAPEVDPGTDVPYTITVTNTGEWPIENPVFTDIPSVDGELMLNPDAEEPYEYALEPTGTAPAGWQPMPTDADDVTVTVTPVPGSGDAYEFAFPDGTALGVGQSYTITLHMQIVPGVVGGTTIFNTASVSGDRLFDECGGETTGAPYDECSAETSVSVNSAGAARSGKYSRADDEELGAFDALTGEACAPTDAPDVYVDGEAHDFYAYPCVPLSTPGGTETWRFVAQNTGNLPMDEMILVDLLPTPGDTGALSDLERDSEWTPIFLDDISGVQLPAGATMTYEVTTGAVCAGDLYNTDPNHPDPDHAACAEGDWVDPATVDPADVTGVQITIDMSATPLQPGDAVIIDGVTETPLVSATAGSDTIAWNSLALGAHVTQEQSSGTQAMRPSEGTKTGVALATGEFRIDKTVTGDGAFFAPDSFDVQVICPLEDPYDDIVVDATVTPGTPTVIDGLPLGITCSVTEDGLGNGETSFSTSPETVTAQVEGPDLEAITVTNVYQLAGLDVSKQVESPARDADGNELTYGPFEMSVECSYLGETVWAPPYLSSPMTFELDADESLEIYGMPVGTTCVVSETDTADAASTTIASETAAGSVAPIEATTTTVTLTADDILGVTNFVDVVNTYLDGSLVIEKVLAPIDTPFAGGPYEAHVTCTLDGTTAWDGDVTMSPDAPTQIDHIAAGSSCVVTETQDGGASSSTVSPGTVTIPADASQMVTVTNTFAEGSVTVSKELNPVGTPWGAESYEVTMVCVDFAPTVHFVDIPGGATRTLSADSAPAWTATYDRLPADAYCLLWESDNGGATSSDVVNALDAPVSYFQVEADTDFALTVVNTFDVGDIEVTKTTSGDGAELWGEQDFDITVTCDFRGEPITLPSGPSQTISLPDDNTVTFEDLPLGAECDVRESDAGGASDTVITPNDGDESVGVVTVASSADPVEVSIDNRFDVGELIVTKTVSGDGAAWGTGEFQVTATCTWQGDEIEIPGGATRTLSVATGLTATYEDLPDGAQCVVTEPESAYASGVTISPSGAVTIEPDAEVTVAVDNRFDVGSVTVVKEFAGEGAALGSETTFWVQLSCEWNGEEIAVPGLDTRPLTDGNDYTTTFDGLPNGAECIVEETYTGGATEVTLDPVDGVVTVAENADVQVTVTNTFDAGSLRLEKSVDGPGAEYFGEGPFVFDIVCTLDDGRVLPHVVYTGQVTLGGDEPWESVIDGIPTGSACAVIEIDDGVADSHEITGSPATIGTDDEVTISAVNTFLTGSVAVEKTVTGDTTQSPGAFEVTLRCIDPDNDLREVEIPGGSVRELTAENDFSTVYEVLPSGALCGIAETGDGGADATQLLDENGNDVGVITLNSGSQAGFFEVHTDERRSFTLVNHYDAPLPVTGSDARASIVLGVFALLMLFGGVALVRAQRGRTSIG